MTIRFSTAAFALAALCALSLFASNSQAAQASLSAGLTRSVLEADKKQIAYLKSVDGLNTSTANTSAPVNISLVIDRLA